MALVLPYPRMPEVRNSTSGGKHIKYLNMLSKVAADIPQPVGGNARLSACIVYKGDIVSFGINEKKSHPFQAKYGKNADSVFLHAETSAIKNALKYITQEDLEKSTLYVCRVKYMDYTKKQMIFGLSKPCPGCFRCINTFNIRQVVFSLDGNDYSVL